MPFQRGNQLGKLPRTDRPFRAALQRVLADDRNPHTLEKIAAALLARASAGDMAAISLIAERLDGKVPQQLTGDPSAKLTIERIERVILPAPVLTHGDGAGEVH